MQLILSGSWLGKSGFYEADIENISFYKTLNEIEKIPPLSFSLFSYHLSSETLKLNIKKPNLIPIVIVRIRKFKKIIPKFTSVRVSFINKVLKDEEFKLGVSKVREFIQDGTVYQINLTNRFDFELHGSPLALFFNFYRNQPVPYAFFLDVGSFFIISGSMELFLEKVGDKIISKPIKGTSKSESFLRESLKDKAENLMITDMMRNDIGRVSKFGSVRVTELFKITKYKTLYQMHSTVEGKTDKNIIEIINQTFPPASVTGAPKRKAVEVIDILEPHEREYYCGCAGLIKNEKDFTLSVLIRTAIGFRDIISYYAGCGIVWDSIPEKELKELYLKVKAFWCLIEP
ncbi:MAG: anthranilate synthase component I family protein [Thermodesulfovibrio sp.]|nr:anthranilate synthase component I family protein [Thermodesulfovibrio sp.]MCX7725142.1 anthranilate synthase component I family protein [Thermodesulfovibrio sp.]MDW7972005.1 chorismate-binding protein [Thermodesulfovibrio sp.]